MVRLCSVAYTNRTSWLYTVDGVYMTHVSVLRAKLGQVCLWLDFEVTVRLGLVIFFAETAVLSHSHDAVA